MKSLDWKGILEEHPVFSLLSGDEIERLLDKKVSKERKFQEGATILTEGDSDDSIFLIGLGEVEIVLLGKGDDKIHLNTLGEGEYFGEMAVFERQPRSATVIAAERCALLEIEGRAFLKLVDKHPEIELKVIGQLSARLRRVGRQIIKVQRDLHEEVAFLNTKLDVQSKETDATLKATQTVFEQTNKRANEIIDSADRSRTRLTVAASAIGTIIAAVVAVLGFVGISEVENIRDIREEIEIAKGEIEVAKGEIKAAKGEIEAAKKEARSMALDAKKVKSLQLVIDRVNKEYMQTIVRRFGDELDWEKGKEPDINQVDADYKLILTSGDPNLSDQAFKAIYSGIRGPTNRLASRIILDAGIKEYTQTDRQKMLSYYLLLVALILDDEAKEYEGALEKFKDYLHGYTGLSPKKDFRKHFNPKLYDAYLDRQVKDQKLDRKTADRKKNLIEKVWAEIPG